MFAILECATHHTYILYSHAEMNQFQLTHLMIYQTFYRASPGLWGGTSMIPLHFAAMSGYGGPSYVISFACGAMLINVVLWVLRYLFELYRLDGAFAEAYHALPSFHIRDLWYLGGLSGLLWSMGNFASIISVTFLGQGIGYSFTQSSMLISGLW